MLWDEMFYEPPGFIYCDTHITLWPKNIILNYTTTPGATDATENWEGKTFKT